MSRGSRRRLVNGAHKNLSRSLTHVPRVDVARVAGVVDFNRFATPRFDPERAKPRVEKAVFGFGIINPMLALPQLYQIFALKHVAGLSLVTIASALIMAILWTAYGALGRQTVVWITSSVWVVLHTVTLVGVAMFSY